MELSIAYELYMKPHEVDTDTAMKITRQAGFKYVDMTMGMREPILESSHAWAEAAIESAKKYGINMHQAHCLLFNYMDKNAPNYEYLTNVNIKLLELCKILGVKYFIFHPGTSDSTVSRKSSIERTREYLLPFAELAEKLGIKLCLENNFDVIGQDRTILRAVGARPDELLEVVESLDSENVGICWDCGHAHIAKLDQKESLHLLGERVWTTHIHDNRGQYDNDLHIPPFYGSIDWQSLMEGLCEINYKGTFNFEIERHTIPLDFVYDEFVSIYKKGERLLSMMK